MTLTGFHHIAIIASNYERSKAFYTEIIGCRIIGESYREERKSHKLDLAMPDGSQIELFTFPGAPPRPSGPEAQGLRHIAFATHDIEADKAELEFKGIEVEPIRIDGLTGRRFTFFADPDGLPLELYEK